jgi:hypothetical protein
MKKLALDADALRVESFETVDARGGRGTVWAHDSVCTVAPYPSCGRTCGNQPACTDLGRDGAARATAACCI